MAISSNHFYHGLTKKYISLFGTLFNKLSIARYEDNYEVQKMPVPINYGPYQKFLARIKQDPNLDKKPAISLPRMSFEIVDYRYDSSRKHNSVQKMGKRYNEADNGYKYVWAPTPYEIDFNLSIMTKYSEDGTQILEQILPFFKPEMTVSVKLLDGYDSYDIPIILNAVSTEDLYEGAFEERRSLIWNLSFTMKVWYFGPLSEASYIKYMDLRFVSDSVFDDDFTEYDKVTHQPGLTANGEPTTDIDETIPYNEIGKDDNWAVITRWTHEED